MRSAGEWSAAAALAIYFDCFRQFGQMSPCLSWRVAIDETEISVDLRFSHEAISADTDVLSELWRCLHCMGSPWTDHMVSHSAVQRTGAVTAMTVI